MRGKFQAAVVGVRTAICCLAGSSLTITAVLASDKTISATATDDSALSLFLKNYQTLLVGAAAFTIGLLTVFNAALSTIISAKNRKHDRKEAEKTERKKQIAFFAILQSELEHITESLNTSRELLISLESTQIIGNSWISYVRIASNISKFRSFEHEWDKIYIIGPNNIKRLRAFDLALSDLDRSFKQALSLQDNGALPLFERVSREDDGDRMASTLSSLIEHIDGALDLGRKLNIIATATVQEKEHAVEPSAEP